MNYYLPNKWCINYNSWRTQKSVFYRYEKASYKIGQVGCNQLWQSPLYTKIKAIILLLNMTLDFAFKNVNSDIVNILQVFSEK